MKKVNKIIANAVKILDYLIVNNAMYGKGAKVRDIFESLDLSNEDFEVADLYLLQQKYVDGTMGGMDGSRYLQSSGVNFYENNSSLLNVTPSKQGNESMPDSKKVFVVHGRDRRLRDDFFAFLRALDLDPIEWSEALKLTGKATPYIGEALDSAFNNAQAVIVLLSPDDEVRLSPDLWKGQEEENEKEFKLQARPNVLFEAGRAFGTHPDRTLLIEVGQVKAFSDVAGRHVIRLSNSAEKRNEVAERLRTSGCNVKTSGSDWLKTGNFDINRGNKISTPQSVDKLPEEAEKVLMFFTKHTEVTASQIAHGISLDLTRTEHWLDTLDEAEMIYASYSMMSDTTYSIAPGGRKYLVNNNMI